MSIVPRQGSSPGHAVKSGRPSSSSITFTTGPFCIQPGGAATPARSAVVNGSAPDTTARAATSSPPASTTPAARPSPLSTRSTGRSRCTSAPAASAAERSARVTAPMPPRA